MGPPLVEGEELLLREIALQRQGGIDRGARVALAHHQLVPILPLGILGIDPHFPAIEHGQELHHAHGAADVAKAQMAQLLQRLHPDLFRKDPEILIFFHKTHLPSHKNSGFS